MGKKPLRASIVALVLLFFTAVAWAQHQSGTPRMSTLVDRFMGEGEEVPAARIVFHLGDGDQLCATVGTKRGPEAFNKSSFIFTHVQGEATQNLQFPFPKKPDRKEKAFMVWEACLTEEVPSAGDLQVTFRRMGRVDYTREKMVVGYPDGEESSGINVNKTSAGGISWAAFYKTYEGRL